MEKTQRKGRFVKNKRSKKRTGGIYEFTYFGHPAPRSYEISSFLGDLGKLKYNKIVLKDGRIIGLGQFLLRDDKKEKILSFDPTIFYDWFTIVYL